MGVELTLFRAWLVASAVWVGTLLWIALCFWLVLSSWLEGFVFWALIPPCAALLVGQVLLLVLTGIRRLRWFDVRDARFDEVRKRALEEGKG